MNNQKLLLVPIMLIIAVATGLLLLSPPINAQEQMYNDRNEYSSDYNNDYSHDNQNSKKSSDVNIQKIKCVNSNLNVNGIDITEIPQSPPIWDESGHEGTIQGTNTQQNGNEPADSLNVERNLVNICANVNANDQLKVEEPATLTVNKEIFGCVSTSNTIMNCRSLPDGSSSWLQCDNPAISGTTACQNLAENLFDIEVLNDQNTQIQQFEGSAQGTTIEDLSPGTYSVNEIEVPPPATNQLTESDPNENLCVDTLGFDDGASLRLIPEFIGYAICFEYEDEQGNDCSTLTLQSGEDKICTVKNYIVAQDFFD